MKNRIYALKEAERIVPLLRSIGSEIQSRRRAADQIEGHLETANPKSHEERVATSNLEAQLATHLRELRAAEKELERLGCRFDEQHPDRILIPSPNGHWAFDGPLDDTRFYATPAGGVS
jgi:hypothetical protein